jgi:glycosyltransferase involved in cell wall biosynthesis
MTRTKNIRVCMLAYANYDEDTRIMRYAESLARRGDEVDVFGLGRERQPRRDFLNGVNVYRLQCRPATRSKFSYIFSVLIFLVRTSFLLAARHFRKPYRVIHVHSVPDFLVFAALIPKLTGAKVILDIHDLLPEFYASKYKIPQTSATFQLLVAVERLSGASSDHVIAANDLWLEKLIRRSSSREKCTSLVNVPDREIFRQSGRTRMDDRFVLLYPGTLNWHQGLDLAIRAFSLVKDAVPNAEFYIYGEGPSRSTLEQLVVELGLADRVFIRDFLPTRTVVKIIENADLGVVPKRKDGFGDEAFSTKIMEFMALGVPVIVPDTRVDKFYFHDNIVEFFRGGDVESLAAAILSLAKDKVRREQLVKRASAFIEKNDWKSMEEKYFRIVDSLVNGEALDLNKDCEQEVEPGEPVQSEVPHETNL